MIVFDLICRDQHRFEGWFASGDDFNLQRLQGLLECPVCGGTHVEKLPAAKIRTQSESALTPDPVVEQPGTQKRPDIAQIVDYILSHSEDVGNRFADEARKMHYQEVSQRNIRGVATPTETEELRDEGIPVFSLPVPPQDRWN